MTYAVEIAHFSKMSLQHTRNGKRVGFSGLLEPKGTSAFNKSCKTRATSEVTIINLPPSVLHLIPLMGFVDSKTARVKEQSVPQNDIEISLSRPPPRISFKKTLTHKNNNERYGATNRKRGSERS